MDGLVVFFFTSLFFLFFRALLDRVSEQTYKKHHHGTRIGHNKSYHLLSSVFPLHAERETGERLDIRKSDDTIYIVRHIQVI